MANFDTTNAALQSVGEARDLIGNLRRLYQDAKRMQALLARYTAGTDTKFNATINTLYSTAERTELQAMLADVNTLVTAWEALHGGAIGTSGGTL